MSPGEAAPSPMLAASSSLQRTTTYESGILEALDHLRGQGVGQPLVGVAPGGLAVERDLVHGGGAGGWFVGDLAKKVARGAGPVWRVKARRWDRSQMMQRWRSTYTRWELGKERLVPVTTYIFVPRGGRSARLVVCRTRTWGSLTHQWSRDVALGGYTRLATGASGQPSVGLAPR